VLALDDCVLQAGSHPGAACRWVRCTHLTQPSRRGPARC
jgi:hypothetical protein